MKAYYTTGDIAELLEVSVRTVQMWVDKGLLRGTTFPPSQHRRVTPAELERFVTEYGLFGSAFLPKPAGC